MSVQCWATRLSIGVTLFLTTSWLAAAPPLAVVPFDENAALAHQQAWATHLGLPSVEQTNSINLKLRLIPRGQFKFRVYTQDPNNPRDFDVTTPGPFLLGTTEVTRHQWLEIMGADSHPVYMWRAVGKLPGPLRTMSEIRRFNNYPATFVRWQDAEEFCKRLGKREGKVYRLPTEIEWEFACRSGANTKFHFGDDESKLGEYAWFSGNAATPGVQSDPLWFKDGSPHPVGKKKPNAFGLFDMHGNVMEFGIACYHRAANPNAATLQVAGLQGESGRLKRSGPACMKAGYQQCNTRMFFEMPAEALDSVYSHFGGLRVVQVVPQQ